MKSAGVGLSAAGRPVPIWIEDGGDGTFGPGDGLEFVGERLAGESSYLNEHTRYNVYTLRLDAETPARMNESGKQATDGSPSAQTLRAHQHLEQDLMILRLAATRGDEAPELWYWSKLVHNQREPFSQILDLSDLASHSSQTVELRLHFRGWSDPRAKASPEVADHSVRVSIGGVEVATEQWNGTEPHLLAVPSLAASSLVQGDNLLEIQVPKRPEGKDGATLIDVVMLNWIEISYPRTRRVGERQAYFDVEQAQRLPEIRLVSEPGELLVYGDAGTRTVLASDPTRGRDAEAEYRFRSSAGESAFFATRRDRLMPPAGISLDHPSRLSATDNRADYVIVAHRKLLPAIEPLAKLHRSRGLEVEIVDIEDVYDEFHHGVAHPQALRTFLEHAYRQWTPPAPRYVLLVGDASWDGKNALVNDANYADWTYRPSESARFVKNQSTAYAEDAHLNHRNLIPTWKHATSQGHSASDNYFVAFGEDHMPMMAIGRLPVVEPGEVAGIVDKTIRYISEPEVGPWRRNVLFITNESRSFQNQSDRVAGGISTAGFAPHKIYPASSEVSNEHHSSRLIDSFDDGQLFVHFLGHGGRYIWRTGPPDLKKNHDLFTLDHLDQLAPSGRLPMVMSLTCYSAPFDHPSADSIGEKLLRVEGRGAVAVFAASWRNSPSARWGQVLFDELTQEGATVGEAIVRSKQQIRNRLFVETYNLLGDPAVPVALPAGEIALEASVGDGTINVQGLVDLPEFSGEALIDLVDAAGETLSTTALELDGRQLEAELVPSSAHLAEVKTVRAYAWNLSGGVDAVGAVELPRAETADLGAAGAGGRR